MKDEKQQNQRHAGAKQASGQGDMSVREAGQMGGHKGGQRERELVEKGHQAEDRGNRGKR
jgi:hypothetical protein